MVPNDEALRIQDDVAFFQAVQAVLAKRAPGNALPEKDVDYAVRQISSRAVSAEGVVDIFAAAGLDKPDISILSDEFLAEVRGMDHPNLAVELLRRLLSGEELRLAIVVWIERTYHRRRRQRALGKLTPDRV